MALDEDVTVRQIEELRERVRELEQRLPDTNVISPKFWTRALAIFGHQIALTAIIWALLFGIFLVFAFLGFSMAALSPANF